MVHTCRNSQQISVVARRDATLAVAEPTAGSGRCGGAGQHLCAGEPVSRQIHQIVGEHVMASARGDSSVGGQGDTRTGVDEPADVSPSILHNRDKVLRHLRIHGESSYRTTHLGQQSLQQHPGWRRRCLRSRTCSARCRQHPRRPPRRSLRWHVHVRSPVDLPARRPPPPRPVGRCRTAAATDRMLW